jgi:hypothetical protein
VGVGERGGEEDLARFELGGEGIGVGDGEVGVPAGVGIAGGVGEWGGGDLFEEEHGGVAGDDGEEGVLRGFLVEDLEAEAVAVEGEGAGEVADDEEGSYGLNRWAGNERCSLRAGSQGL